MCNAVSFIIYYINVLIAYLFIYYSKNVFKLEFMNINLLTDGSFFNGRNVFLKWFFILHCVKIIYFILFNSASVIRVISGNKKYRSVKTNNFNLILFKIKLNKSDTVSLSHAYGCHLSRYIGTDTVIDLHIPMFPHDCKKSRF